VQQQLAKAQRSLLGQFAGASVEQRANLLQKVLDASQQLRIRPVQLTTAAGELAGATTGEFANREQLIFRTLKQIAPLFISKPEEAGAFAGAFQSFLQTTKLKNIDLSDEEAFSLLLQARGQARITSEEKLKNFIPVVKTLEATTQGALTLQDLRVAAGLFALIGTRAEDPGGEKTRTAEVKLIQRLEKRFPDRPLSEQLEAAAALRGRGLEEFLKPFAALRGIGPIVTDILSGRQAEQLQEIVDAIQISTKSNEQLMGQMLFGNEVLRQDTATRTEQVRQELKLLNSGGFAGVRRRALPGEVGPGFIATNANAVEAFIIQTITRVLLGTGVDPQSVESFAAKASAFGVVNPISAAGFAAANLIKNSDRLEELNQTLKTSREAFSADQQPVTPEN